MSNEIAVIDDCDSWEKLSVKLGTAFTISRLGSLAFGELILRFSEREETLAEFKNCRHVGGGRPKSAVGFVISNLEEKFGKELPKANHMYFCVRAANAARKCGITNANCRELLGYASSKSPLLEAISGLDFDSFSDPKTPEDKKQFSELYIQTFAAFHHRIQNLFKDRPANGKWLDDKSNAAFRKQLDSLNTLLEQFNLRIDDAAKTRRKGRS